MNNEHPTGPTGNYGPNDLGYINCAVRRAAVEVQRAIYLYCEGHYPHSNARSIHRKHPLVKAIKALAKVDEETAAYANVQHDPKLFTPYEPPEENQHRWPLLP